MVEQVGNWFDDSIIDENEPLAAAMQQIESTFARTGEAARQTGRAVSQFRDVVEEYDWRLPLVRHRPGQHVSTTWMTDDREVEITTVNPRYPVSGLLRPIRNEMEMGLRTPARINAEYENGTIIGATLDRLAAGYLLWPNCRMESMSTAQVGDVLETVRRLGRPQVEWVQRDPIEFRIRPQTDYVERPSMRIVSFQVHQYQIPTRNSLMILHGA
jgi:hypothetical protein